MNKFVLKNEDFDDYLHANWLIDTTIKQLEDEIDIQSIEEIDIEQVIGTDDKTGIALLHINKLLQWAKQIDKKIKEKE